MTTAGKLQTQGIRSQQAKAILGDVESAITATGTTAADAYAIKASITVLSAGAGTTGIVLPVAAASDNFKIVNQSGSNKILYPPTGGTLNDAAIDASITLADNDFDLITALNTIDFAVIK